jgi:MtN3 and saliva related transmembrane protein
MIQMSLNEIRVPLGTVAAICTTGAFLPQLLKTRRDGGRDLSYTMLSIYLLGVLLWLAYGFVIADWAVIVANVVTAFLVATCIAIKWRFKRSAEQSDNSRKIHRQSATKISRQFS